MKKRREFIKRSILTVTGATLSSLGYSSIKNGIIRSDNNIVEIQNPSMNISGKRNKLSEVGWCWDGQAINGQWQLSIFGAGEGTKWFDLNKCCFMFHPNTNFAMEKLRHMKKVICDISKWDYHKVDCPGYVGLEAHVAMKVDGSVERKKREARKVSQLSKIYPNITGAFDDDLIGIIKRDNITPEQYYSVHQELKSINPKLEHWIVIYSNQLIKEDLLPYKDTFDVISLWIWESKDIVNLDKYIEQCREIFPDKPINLGYYLFDYNTLKEIPINLLKHQWNLVAKYVNDDIIHGYSLLGGFLIDFHPEHAKWVRDFIKSN